jgi:branched-chain amino acid transport system ATP-binding protein
MVEQNARRALAFSDQAFVLELGRVRIEGTGRTVLGDPQVRALYLGLATARGNVDRDGGD